jgi:hypothetical protein
MNTDKWSGKRVWRASPNNDRRLDRIAPNPDPSHLRLSEFICGFIYIVPALPMELKVESVGR